MAGTNDVQLAELSGVGSAEDNVQYTIATLLIVADDLQRAQTAVAGNDGGRVGDGASDAAGAGQNTAGEIEGAAACASDEVPAGQTRYAVGLKKNL